VSLPVIANVSAGSVTATSAIITWSTDKAASSQVEYGNSSAYGSMSAMSATAVSSHTLTVTGLTPGAVWNYAVMSGNSAGTTTSANFTFSTPAQQSAPPPPPQSGPAPVLQNVSYWGVTGSGITVAWSTDQLSNTSIQYGTAASLGQSGAVQTATTLGHGATLTGLADNTVYYFRAVSSNASGATGYSPIYPFRTLDTTAPVISNITVAPASGNGASVAWAVSKSATSQVEYGSTTSYGLWSGSTGATSARLGWVPSGTIHYRIHSADPSGNQAVSPDSTFIEP
jgi:hypothetical protein